MNRGNRVIKRILVLCLGVVVFLISNAVTLASTAPATSDVVTVKEVVEQAEADQKLPMFSGELNGITFRTAVSAVDMGCDPKDQVHNAAQAELTGSPLVFSAGYIPKSLTAQPGEGAVCGTKVIAYGFELTGPKKEELNIVRYPAPFVVAQSPKERFETLTVQGKQAVLIHQLPIPGSPRSSDPHNWSLVVKEASGITVITGRHLPRTEIIKVAEGMK